MRHSYGLGFLTAATLALAAPAVVKANLVTNGSFESVDAQQCQMESDFTQNPHVSFLSAGSSSTALPGWTITGATIDFVSYWQPEDGTLSIDLIGTAPGGVSQTVNDLIPGRLYELHFFHSINPEVADPEDSQPKILDVSVLDSDQDALNLSATGNAVYLDNNHVTYTMSDSATGPTLENMQWIQDSVTFLASTPSETIRFAADVTQSSEFALAGPVLDNVSLLPVPEPTTLPIAAGAMALLLVLQRRKPHLSPTAK